MWGYPPVFSKRVRKLLKIKSDAFFRVTKSAQAAEKTRLAEMVPKGSFGMSLRMTGEGTPGRFRKL